MPVRLVIRSPGPPETLGHQAGRDEMPSAASRYGILLPRLQTQDPWLSRSHRAGVWRDGLSAPAAVGRVAGLAVRRST